MITANARDRPREKELPFTREPFDARAFIVADIDVSTRIEPDSCRGQELPISRAPPSEREEELATGWGENTDRIVLARYPDAPAGIDLHVLGRSRERPLFCEGRSRHRAARHEPADDDDHRESHEMRESRRDLGDGWLGRTRRVAHEATSFGRPVDAGFGRPSGAGLDRILLW